MKPTVLTMSKLLVASLAVIALIPIQPVSQSSALAAGRSDISLWYPIGHANYVVAMCALNGKLFAATSENILWMRDPVPYNVNWQPIGHANYIVAMTAINGKLFAFTADQGLWMRDPVPYNVNWRRIGSFNKGTVVAMAATYGPYAPQLVVATSDNSLWMLDLWQ